MTKIISIHSFRRGTGKSTVVANLAYLLAQQGQRVGVIDTNFQSPTLNTMFGLVKGNFSLTLNDYLWGDCKIEEATYPIDLPQDKTLYLVPAQPDVLGNINKILRRGYADNLLALACEDLIESRNLDILLIDLYAGLQEETLFTINISDILILVLRPDPQDYQGTSVVVSVTKHFTPPPDTILVLNELPLGLNELSVQTEIKRTYDCETVFTVSHAEEMVQLNRQAVFAALYPQHKITSVFKNISTFLAN